MNKTSFKLLATNLFVLLTFHPLAHADLNDGLVAYYPFNGNANDESGNGNDGQVYTPDVTFVSNDCVTGGCAKFIEGVKNKAITVPYSDSLEFTNKGLTISVWVKLDGVDTDWNGCGNAVLEKANADYVLWVCEKTGGGIGAWVGGSGYYINYNQPLPLNKWAYVALTYDGSSAKLYQDNKLVKTLSTGLVARDAHNDLIIGASPIGGTEEFSGFMDELRIYNRALSDSEIQQLYIEGTQHQLKVSNIGDGSGTIISSPAGINCGTTCTADFTNGTTVTLTATPDAGSTFTGWSDACSGSDSCKLTLDADQQVTATFKRENYTLSINKSGNGTVTSADGKINCGTGSDCSASYPSGTQIILSAKPDNNYKFAG